MDHRITAAEAEKRYEAQPLAVYLLDESTGRIAVCSWIDQQKITGRWQLEIDGRRHSFGQFLLTGMTAKEVREYLLSVEVPDMYYGETAVLIIRFYNQDDQEIAVEKFILPPPARLTKPAEKEQFFTGLRFDISRAEISSGKLSAVIGADGMRELRYNGEKLLTSGPRLSLWRAQRTPESLNDLALDRPRISADRFVSDGKSVECHSLFLPRKMEMDELEFTQRFTPQEDGSIRYDMEFVVPESFSGIPRLGVMLRLPGKMKNISFFGNGPFENYPASDAAVLSTYNLTVDEMYPEYKNAVSGGTRSEVRKLELSSDDGQRLQIIAGNSFSFSALPFSEYAIDDAAKAGKMPEADGEIHLHIDCRIGDVKTIQAGLFRMTIFFKA